MMVSLLFIIGHMGLFFYNKIGSIIPAVDLPTTEIIEPFYLASLTNCIKWVKTLIYNSFWQKLYSKKILRPY